jgi:two-component system, LuxR family, sensor kinase FixL
MNWITIAWPMVAAACLMLAMIELRIGLVRPMDAARLLFSVSAFATAAVCGLELAMMHADSPAQFQTLLRWGDVGVGVMIASLTAFIWIYFRSGTRWLALAGPGLYAVAVVFDFLPPRRSLGYLKMSGLRTIETFGGASYRVAEGVPNPLDALTYLGVLMLLVFVVDASLRLARRGERRRALVVGGSVAFWVLAAGVHSALIESGLVRMPYLISVTYLVILLAMSYELTTDVSAAAQLGRELQESERRMELASTAAGLGLWSWNLASDEVWATAKARSLLGFVETERLDQARFMRAVHPDDRDAVRLAFESSLRNGHDFEVEHRVQVSGGQTRWIIARGRVERDSGRKPILMRGVVLDISAQRRSQLDLLQLQGQLAHTSRVSMMGQLASALAHELNQPLGAILRNAEAAELFLQHDPPDLDELRPILADIRADNQRARDVIEHLRALLKRRSIEPHALLVADLMGNIAVLTRADAAARRITLEIESGSGLPQVMGDAVHLQQVLLNLVLNAMDAIDGASGNSRRIAVRARYPGARAVEVAVSDSGQGIAPERLGLIFEPFFTTKTNGMGIGLSISRTIIEAHGGRIWAENCAPEGAMFRFTLPVAEECLTA